MCTCSMLFRRFSCHLSILLLLLTRRAKVLLLRLRVRRWRCDAQGGTTALTSLCSDRLEQWWWLLCMLLHSVLEFGKFGNGIHVPLLRLFLSLSTTMRPRGRLCDGRRRTHRGAGGLGHGRRLVLFLGRSCTARGRLRRRCCCRGRR